MQGRIHDFVGGGGGGGQGSNLSDVSNMKRRGVWGIRRQENDSEQFWMSFLKELKNILLCKNIIIICYLVNTKLLALNNIYDVL